jgi:hypothetical protein
MLLLKGCHACLHTVAAAAPLHKLDCCRRWTDYEDKELDQTAVKLAEMVIKVGGTFTDLTKFDASLTMFDQAAQQQPCSQPAGHASIVCLCVADAPACSSRL